MRCASHPARGLALTQSERSALRVRCVERSRMLIGPRDELDVQLRAE